MKDFINRDIEKYLKKTVEDFAVVILTGARQSGKSTLIKNLFPQFKYVLLDELDTLNYAKSDPRGFLKQYSPPLIIDEIQECPELLSYIKRVVDESNQEPSQYIITGSQQFNLMEGVQESLGGRAAILDLSTFSLSELKTIYKTEKHWSFWVHMGSYPKLWHSKNIDKRTFYSSYIRTVLDKDIKAQIQKNYLSHYERFINLLFARCSQIINYSDIAKDIGVDIKTIQTWIKFLERSQIIFLLQPYLKSFGKRITKSPKLYFYDTGIVAYSLGFTTMEQIRNGPMSGAFFENLTISDIVKKNFSKGNPYKFYFYRESNGLEVDLLIESQQKITAIEIKSNETPTSSHAKNLEQFQAFSKQIEKLILLSPREENLRINNIDFQYFKDFTIKL